LPEREGQHFALGPPPERVGECHGDPEVGPELPPHGLEGGRLEESLTRRRFLDLYLGNAAFQTRTALPR
jgi:hypothetical protein